eukprot:CAMPEP_0177678048 /NCGR_PEP_ID=MMETSP0447-20121125/28786_1 /TAXON_ID=0 /ORGANISM="Stygamoeba regulata, Strain BSH-02190019" /LENGTH=32 /DNA_ID= /DNA_START= /DNA_END= /DNA_ORIENTATION=
MHTLKRQAKAKSPKARTDEEDTLDQDPGALTH